MYDRMRVWARDSERDEFWKGIDFSGGGGEGWVIEGALPGLLERLRGGGLMLGTLLAFGWAVKEEGCGWCFDW